MTRIASLSPYWLWALCSIPGLLMIIGLSNSNDPQIFQKLLHPSGEFSARFLIIAMLASPLCLIFKGWRGPLWLKKNRRYFGVASFAYAVLHTVFYVLANPDWQTIFVEMRLFYIWTGWMALVIFVPLAITSTDNFVKRMGPAWKTLQRFTYAAAVLTLLHWAALHEWKNPGAAIVHFLPLGLLSLYRLWYWYGRAK